MAYASHSLQKTNLSYRYLHTFPKYVTVNDVNKNLDFNYLNSCHIQHNDLANKD